MSLFIDDAHIALRCNQMAHVENNAGFLEALFENATQKIVQPVDFVLNITYCNSSIGLYQANLTPPVSYEGICGVVGMSNKKGCLTRGYQTAEKAHAKTMFILFMVIMCGVTVIIGLITNTLSFLVLSKQRQTTIIFLLKALTISDIFVLITYIFSQVYYGAYLAFDLITKDGGLLDYLFPYVAPIKKMAETASVWFAVLLAVERYIVVRYPLKARVYLTMKRTRMACLAVAIYSVCFNVIHFWDYHTIYKFDNCTQKSWPYFTQIGTPLRNNPLYQIIFRAIIIPIFRLILPCTILLIINIRLVCILRTAAKVRLRMLSQDRRNSGACGMVPQKNTAKIMNSDETSRLAIPRNDTSNTTEFLDCNTGLAHAPFKTANFANHGNGSKSDATTSNVKTASDVKPQNNSKAVSNHPTENGSIAKAGSIDATIEAISSDETESQRDSTTHTAKPRYEIFSVAKFYDEIRRAAASNSSGVDEKDELRSKVSTVAKHCYHRNASASVAEDRNAVSSVAKDRNAVTNVVKDRNAAASVVKDRNAIVSIVKDRNAAASVVKEGSAEVSVPKDRNAAAKVAKDRNTAASVAKDRNAVVSIAKDCNAAANVAKDCNAAANVAKSCNTVSSLAKYRNAATSVAKDCNVGASAAKYRSAAASVAKDRNASVSVAKDRNSVRSNAKHNSSLTRMVIGVVFVLLTCQSLYACRSILVGLNSINEKIINQNKILKEFYVDSYYPGFWLVAMNSAVNFFVYILASRSFRNTLLRMCGCSFDSTRSDRPVFLNSRTEMTHI